MIAASACYWQGHHWRKLKDLDHYKSVFSLGFPLFTDAWVLYYSQVSINLEFF